MEENLSKLELKNRLKEDKDYNFYCKLSIGMVVGWFVGSGILYVAVNSLAAIIGVVIGVIFVIPLSLGTYFSQKKRILKKIQEDAIYGSNVDIGGDYQANPYAYNGGQNTNSTADKVAETLLNIGASYALGKAVTKAMDDKPIFKMPEAGGRDPLADAKAAREKARNVGQNRTKVSLVKGGSGWLSVSPNGSQTLTDSGNRRVAVYDAIRNETTDGNAHKIGKGNLLGQFYR